MFLFVFEALSLTFAIAHAEKRKFVMLIRIGHTCVILKHKKTDLPLETSSEINSKFIIFVKNVNYLPLTKPNKE